MTNEISRNTLYEEDFVIGELLKSSKEFKAFYKAEITKITRPIKWIKNEFLKEESPARYGHVKGVIELRRIPPKTEDAIIIAHELQHAVIKSKGFPGTIGTEAKYENLSTALNSMVHDPLVNEALQIYGFDLLGGFTKLKNKSLDALIKASPPTNDSHKMHYVFNYVKNILLWEIICVEEDNELQLRFESLYPELANKGQELLTLAKGIGYDTPEKMRKLIREIITKYRLSNYILEAD